MSPSSLLTFINMEEKQKGGLIKLHDLLENIRNLIVPFIWRDDDEFLGGKFIAVIA